MSSQSSGIHTPNNNSDPTSSFSNKIDLSVYGSPVQIRQNRNVARRASSFVKMATEDHPTHLEEGNNHRPARLVRSDARRGSSFIKAMSEDIGDDSNKYFGKSLSLNKDPNVRRGSSFLMVDDHDDSSGRSIGSSLNKDVRRGSSFIRTQDDSLQHEDHLTIQQNNSPKDIRRGSSFIRTADDSIEEVPRLNLRRGSSFIRMISEDINTDEMHSSGRLSTKPESRRGSGISKVLSEDSSDDNISRRSSRADIRRGSSFARMISEENEDDQPPAGRTDRSASDISEKVRKAIDNNTRNRSQRHSLESISEYKTQTFSSASLYPSVDYSSLSMESTSDFSTDFAMRTTNNENTELNDDRTYVNSSLSYLSWIDSVNSGNAGTTRAPAEDNRSGEWNNFWTNYSSSRNDYFSSPYLCPSNSGEDLYSESNGSTQRGYTDLSLKENVILTVEEVTEALNCTQRLMEILKGAMKRTETEVILTKDDAEEQNVSMNKMIT